MAMPSVAGAIQHLVQALDLRPEIGWMVADEEAMVVGSVGVRRRPADNLVVEVLDGGVPEEVPAGADAEADIRLLERGEDALARDVALRIEGARAREGA